MFYVLVVIFLLNSNIFFKFILKAFLQQSNLFFINIAISQMQNLYSLKKEITQKKQVNNNKSAILSYLQKIKQIKDQFQPIQTSSNFNFKTHTNFVSQRIKSLSQNKCRTVSRLQKQNQHQKLRNKTQKSQMQNKKLKIRNQITPQTTYNQKFVSNIQLPVKYIDQKNQRQRTFIKTQNNFSKSIGSQKKLKFNRFTNSKRRFVTQSNENFFDFVEEKKSINLNSERQQNERAHRAYQQTKTDDFGCEGFGQKNQIIQKIRKYVESLDQKGQFQLNEMLTSSYRKRIRSHSDAYMYECRIKQMISTNRLIVKMIKQQLLDQEQSFKDKIQSHKNTNEMKIELNLAQIRNIEPKSVENGFKDEQSIEDIASFCLSQQNQQNRPQKQIQKSSIQILNPILNLTNSLVQKDEVQKQVQREMKRKPLVQQNQFIQSTKQFEQEWQKSQNHKKFVFKKFKKIIFEHYPQIRERQKQIHSRDKKSMLKKKNSAQDEDFFIQSKQLDQMTGVNKSNYYFKANPFMQSNLKSNQLAENRSQLGKRPSQQVEQCKFIRQSPSKLSESKFSNSVINNTFLKKKQSASKGSTKNLQILQTQDKQHAQKVNFLNLIDFIFKRAFFYSVSQKRIINNKIPFGQMKYVPKVKQKDPSISFLLYSAKSNQKKHLKTKRLNQKNMNGKGQFLIKNKIGIMNIQRQGKKQFDFLRKCIDDAVDDYLKSAKNK